MATNTEVEAGRRSSAGSTAVHSPDRRSRAARQGRPTTTLGSGPTGRSRSCSTIGHHSSTQSSVTTFDPLKAKKVKFYRNGDQFFTGLVYPIKPQLRRMEPYRAFDQLLADLTRTVVCDPSVLKHGVRHIYGLDGCKITGVDQLEDGQCYVCASQAVYQPLDYLSITRVDWVSTSRRISTPAVVKPSDNYLAQFAGHHRQQPYQHADEHDATRSFTPTRNKMIYVIRAGSRPRNIVRKLLNKRTAGTFDVLLTHLAKALDVDTGTIKHIYTIYGRPVTELSHFYLEDYIFLATGKEKISSDEFRISDVEARRIDSGNCPTVSDYLHRSRRSASVHSGTASVNSLLSDAGGYCSEGAMQRSASGEGSFQRDTPSLPVEDESTPVNDLHVPSPADASSATAGCKKTTTVSSASSKTGRQTIVKPKVITRVNRGHSGKAIGIPIPLLNKYKIGRLLVEGDVVAVKRCYEKSAGGRAASGRRLAMKVIRKDVISGDQQMSLGAELALLRKLSHPGLLQLVDELDTPSEWYFVLELFPGGDLFDAIVLADKFRYTELNASRVMLQLLTAVDYLHCRNITHRNIALENILVSKIADEDLTVKLGDFGLATEVTGFLHDVVGSDLYHAPEMFTSKGYGLKVDIWAAGVVLYTLLCGFPPFGSPYSVSELLSSRAGCKQVVFPSSWDQISDAAKDLVLYMLEADQFARGNPVDVMEHPWLMDPASTANDIDIHDPVASKMKDMMQTSTRYVPANVGLVAVTSLDKGLGFQRLRNVASELNDAVTAPAEERPASPTEPLSDSSPSTSPPGSPRTTQAAPAFP